MEGSSGNDTESLTDWNLLPQLIVLNGSVETFQAAVSSIEY